MKVWIRVGSKIITDSQTDSLTTLAQSSATPTLLLSGQRHYGLLVLVITKTTILLPIFEMMLYSRNKNA